jgi:hypothetical protein
MRYLDLNFWINNPFVPWERIWAGLTLAVYLYLIYWTYRDAERRFNSGVWFGLLAAILPVGGWVFYLLYRQSSLTTYDIIEQREKLLDRHPAIEYELYLAYKRQEALDEMIQRMKAFLLGEGLPETEPAISDYPEHIMRSRERELAQHREQKVREVYERARTRVRTRLSVIGQSVQRGVSPRRIEMADKLALMGKLTEIPLPDRQLEELIYEDKLKIAKMYCEDQLQIAKEQNDERRIFSYKHHLRHIEELIQREKDKGEDKPSGTIDLS